MDISKILLLCILCILVILIANKYFKQEFLTNDSPNNNIVAQGDDNLLIPTSDQVYNQNDSNRPNNSLSHQQTNISNNNENTNLVNTSIDIPLVYSNSEIDETIIKRNYTPFYTKTMIDTGSGSIEEPTEINNNALNNFISIE
jgi:hypothetical protein